MMHEKAVRDHYEQRFARERRLGAKRSVLAISCGSTNPGDKLHDVIRRYLHIVLVVSAVELGLALPAEGMRTSLERRCSIKAQ